MDPRSNISEEYEEEEEEHSMDDSNKSMGDPNDDKIIDFDIVHSRPQDDDEFSGTNEPTAIAT
jgi:hypothetical protein